MKKLIYVILVACFALFGVFALTACDKDVVAVDKKYYLYDETTNSYDDDNYISISGDKCVAGVKSDDDGKALKLSGTVENGEDNNFSITCKYKVKSLSDLMSDKEIKEMKEELGLKNFEAEFDALVTFTASGKMYRNTLKIESSKITVSGFKGLLSELNGTMSDSSIDYFCRKGSKPDLSVNATFDFNGGNIGGKSEVVVRTDSDGRVVFPSRRPTRDGYVFVGYSYWPNDYDYIEVKEGVKLEYDRTFYVRWKKLCTVTYDINSTEYKIAGESVYRLEENYYCPRPEIIKTVSDPTTRFMGWFYGDKQFVVGGDSISLEYKLNNDCTLTARWYTKKQVDDYNKNLTWGNNDYLYVHVVSQNSIRDAQYYFHNTSVAIRRIENNGTEHMYGRMFSEYDSVSDYSGNVFAFDLNNTASDETGIYSFTNCALRVVRTYDMKWDSDFEFTIPKSMIKKGKPTHVFYNVDTKELTEKW